MSIKGIIFDKDGTLIDFDAFWVSLSVSALKDILNNLKREDIPVEEFLEVFGVHDGVTDIDGILCKGTYEEMGIAVQGVLEKHGCDMATEEIIKSVLDSYNRNAEEGIVKPVCENIRGVLCGLKNKGIKLAVVTTDNSKLTEMCLKKLGVYDLFDKIYTDDGKTPVKPDPYCANAFADFAGIDKSELLMVGDTMTDVRFAKNAGIKVLAVGKKAESRDRLAPFADFVKPDISYIPEVIGELEV